MNCSKHIVDLERAKDAVIEAARKFCAVRVCTHFSEEEIEKQKQGCLHPLLEALAALDKLEVENDKQ